MIGKVSKNMGKLLSCMQPKDTTKTNQSRRRKMVIVGDGECGKTCLVTRMSTGQFVDSGYLPTVFDTAVVNVNTGKEEVELTVFDTAGQEDYDRLRPFSYNDVDVALISFSLGDTDTLTNVTDKWSPEVRYFCGNIPIILVGNKKDLRDCSEVFDTMEKQTKLSSKTEDMDNNNDEIEDIRNIDVSTVPSCGVNEDNRISWLRESSSSSISMSPQAFYPVQAPVKHSEGVMVANRIGAVAYFETSALTGENVEELLLATTKASVLGAKKSKGFKPLATTLRSWKSINALHQKSIKEY